MGIQAADLFAAGAAALDANDLETAERYFGALLAADKRSHQAWNALSVVAVRSGNPEIAAERARQALALARRNPIYLNNLAVALGELGQLSEAETALRRALKLNPVYAEGMFNLGKVLHKQGRLEDSLRVYERAYAVDEKFPGLRLNLAQVYQFLARADRAVELLRGFEDTDDLLATTFAECLVELEGPERAIAWMKSGARKHPDWPRLRFALGVTLLSIADWPDGWKEYRFRTSVSADDRPREISHVFPASLKGRRILLCGDQGLGDILFFLRFAPALRERGAKVVLHSPPQLLTVLDGNGAIDEITSDPVDSQSFDDTLWIGDLPAALKVSDFPPAIVLACEDAARIRVGKYLSELGPAPYMGVTWRAGTNVNRLAEYGNVLNLQSKEVPLEQLGASLRHWPGTLLALQRNPYPGELNAISVAAGSTVHDLTAANADLVEMLAILSQLQEYVAVSNTNTHLIAGLGKTARILLPHPPEWRWMQQGSESPWFPGFPIYRQLPSRDWDEPLARLRADLMPS